MEETEQGNTQQNQAEGDATTTPKERVILIPVDHSKHAEFAFDWYYENMYHSGDRLLIVHCSELSPPIFPVAIGTEEWQHQLQEHEKAIKELEKHYTEKCHKIHIKATIYIENSPVGHHICKVAKDHGATMIVMGSRGMGVIRRTLVGSTADYVLHHSHIPVTVIPKH